MNTFQGMCPHCEDFRTIQNKTQKEQVKVRKDTVTIDAVYSVCQSCGGDFVSLDQMDANLKAARNKYCVKNGIILPNEIVALRKKYNVSQKTFAKILDIGELTINSYEQGAVPSGAHNSLLRLVADSENMKKLYIRNKKKISLLQQKKIEDTFLLEKNYNFENKIFDSRDDLSITRLYS